MDAGQLAKAIPLCDNRETVGLNESDWHPVEMRRMAKTRDGLSHDRPHLLSELT